MVERSDPTLPSPGQYEPTIPTDEYRQLEEAINNYLEAVTGSTHLFHALGAILGERKRDDFIEEHSLDHPAETACIRRLITGEAECPHSGMEPDPDPEGPPHSPPGKDHATLWLDDGGDPAVYSMHVYPGNIEHSLAGESPENRWFDIFDFARKWGLEVTIRPISWYNIGGCVHVVFYPPEGYRSISGD